MAVAVARLASPLSPRQGGWLNEFSLAGTSVDHATHGFEVMGGIGAMQGGGGDIPMLSFVLDDDAAGFGGEPRTDTVWKHGGQTYGRDKLAGI